MVVGLECVLKVLGEGIDEESLEPWEEPDEDLKCSASENV